MISEHTIEKFKTGDCQAYRNIYNEYAPKLFGYLQKRIHIEDAEDVVQDTFILLWDKRTSIRSDTSLFSFIRTVAINIIYNNHRHNAIEKGYLSNAVIRASIEQESYNPEQEFIIRDLFQYIDSRIKKLPKRQQEIFNLRIKQGLTNKKIAEKLGITEKTVETHIHQSIKKIRKYDRKMKKNSFQTKG
jgi:RNA polymerase sigma-70 factor (ECF subfamily)